MKALFFLSVLFLYANHTFSQLSVSKKQGSSVVTNLGLGYKINKGSSLSREYITINDANSPLLLNDIGIETAYAGSRYSFLLKGGYEAKEPIVAFEVVHLLYNVFGEHMKTLAYQEVVDADGKTQFSGGSWYASESNVKEYLTCVTYVVNVRTKKGIIWRNNLKELKAELDKLEIEFEEGFLPKKKKEEE